MQAEPHAGPSSFHGVGMAAQPSWLPNPKFGSESSTPFSQQVAIDNDSTSGEEATSSSRSAYNATLPGLKALEGLPPAPAEFCVEIMSVRFGPSTTARGLTTLELVVNGEVVAFNEQSMVEGNFKVLWTLERSIFFPVGVTVQVKHRSIVGNAFASLRYQDVRQFWFVDLDQVQLAGALDVKLGVKVTMGAGSAGMRS